MAAWHTTLRCMVDALDFDQAKTDAAAKTTATGADNVPAGTDPTIALHGRAGWAQAAGADIHLSAADEITLASGQDSHWSVGGAYRLHTGQAIGVLAGAVGPGEQAAGTGLTLIAGAGNTELQAQAGTLQIAAREQITIQSQNAHIDWAAAKKITLATAGGASIVIEGGNITFACPGTITVKASAKRFEGPSNVAYEMNAMPGPGRFDEEIRVFWPVGGKPVANQAFEVLRGDGSRVHGKTDASGNTGLQKSDFPENLQIRLLGD